jgi:predicted GNAT superfamily acetyltransferase
MSGTNDIVDRPTTTDEAVQLADSAALAARVRVRELAEVAEVSAVERLYDEIWRPEVAPISTELLRAFAKSGNYVTGAFDGDRLVGASVGFFAAPAGSTLHSHIAGVSATVPGRSIGYALKLHQRAWALLRGVSAREWTFDPLVSRNAYFNFVKLGARPIEYLPDFYGGMRDGINGDDDTDRLLLHWELAAPQVRAACAGNRSPADLGVERDRGAVVALGRSESDEPVTGRLDAALSLVAVPHDIETLRITDPALAKRWRVEVRNTLGALMASGGRVTGFARDGWYVVRTNDEKGRAG